MERKITVLLYKKDKMLAIFLDQIFILDFYDTDLLDINIDKTNNCKLLLFRNGERIKVSFMNVNRFVVSKH